MRITFDTNTLADVLSPKYSQRPTGAIDGVKVRAAIEAGAIRGFFCETLITLEGIKNADRSSVFGSTAINTTHSRRLDSDGDEVSYIDMKVDQSARQPLDKRQADRFLAAFALGMKLLSAPRVGMIRVDDPDGSRYAIQPDESQLGDRLNRYYDVVTAIEARGLGCAQAQEIAGQIEAETGVGQSFLFYLGKPRSQAEQRKINRAIAEWADGDSIAAHFGYGNDLFCSEDFGKSAAAPSVLDVDNRKWLTATFGIRFATLGELALMVQA